MIVGLKRTLVRKKEESMYDSVSQTNFNEKKEESMYDSVSQTNFSEKKRRKCV